MIESTREDTELHFDGVASDYDRLRDTDSTPIEAIRGLLPQGPLQVADIGCGTGRYSKLLFDVLPPQSHMTCVDRNGKMLTQAEESMKDDSSYGRTVSIQNAPAEGLPFHDNGLNVVATFNAIQHFDLPGFLAEVARVLQKDGLLFIYTRLRQQSERTIWGELFPEYPSKQMDLYPDGAIEAEVDGCSGLQLIDRHIFDFERSNSIAELEEKARGKHYSPFSRYTPEEFERAIDEFMETVRSRFPDVANIPHSATNTLFVIQRI